MSLTLTILGGPHPATGAQASHSWRQQGGTIGRAENNDWTLPDPEQCISRCHARVCYQNGSYFLEDTSTNGILLSDGMTRMDSAELHRLHDGEEFFIGNFRIRVSIDSGSVLNAPPSRTPMLPGDEANEQLDPLALLGGEVDSEIDPLKVMPRQESYLNEHLDLPAVENPSAAPAPSVHTPPTQTAPLLPDDWWKQPPETSPASVPPTAATPPTPQCPPELPLSPRDSGSLAAEPSDPASLPPADRTAPPSGSEDFLPPPRSRDASAKPPEPPVETTADIQATLPENALAELLRGAGIDPGQVSPQIADDLGRILRVAVQGVMDLLRARMEIKNEFRMSVTLIQATDNNPLKFSTGVDDALNNLLVKHNPGYLSAVEAFESGFEDLRFHQVAMLAGMREAFFEMLHQLEPETLEERFQRQSRGASMLGLMSRPKVWDQYKDLFAEIRRDTEGYFNRLFGESFVAAYERRMQELKQGARTAERG